MKKNGFIGISLIALVLVACNNISNKNESTQVVTKDTILHNDTLQSKTNNADNLLTQFNLFYAAISEKKIEQLSSFIDNQQGVILIYADGAMPQISKTKNIVEFKTPSGKSFFDIVKFPTINLINDTFPKVNCDTPAFYDKEGAYYNTENRIAQQAVWSSTNLSSKEKNEMQQLAVGLTYNILITGNALYGITYTNGKLKIVFIDFRKPCNA